MSVSVDLDFFRALTLWAAADAQKAGAPSETHSAFADNSNMQLAISRIVSYFCCLHITRLLRRTAVCIHKVSRCAAPRVVEGECLKKLRILKRPSAPPERIYALVQAFRADPAQICASFGGVSQEDLAEELQV
jgi:hypothetical protein